MIFLASLMFLGMGIILACFSYFSVLDNRRGQGPGPAVTVWSFVLGLSFLFIGWSIFPSNSTKETSEPGFRIGAIYEKMVEVKTEDARFISILKDSKGKIFSCKSPRSLPDKFFATEDYEIMPCAPVINIDIKEGKQEK